MGGGGVRDGRGMKTGGTGGRKLSLKLNGG